MEGYTQHEKQNFIVFVFRDSNKKNSYTYQGRMQGAATAANSAPQKRSH